MHVAWSYCQPDGSVDKRKTIQCSFNFIFSTRFCTNTPKDYISYSLGRG